MSDLQIVLIVIGALIICAVLIINWWQERRFHKEVESSFSTLQTDALLDDPKLDVDNVYSDLDDADADDFSIDSPHKTSLNKTLHDVDDDFRKTDFVSEDTSDRYVKPTQSYTVGDALPDDDSLDNVYSQLEHPKAQAIAREIFNQTPDFIDPELQHVTKPAQHDDIKAIFNEAFNHGGKPSASYEADDDAIEPLQAEQASAQYVPEHVEEVKPQDATESLPAILHSQMDLTALLYLAVEAPLNTLQSALAILSENYEKTVFVHVLDNFKVWHELKDAKASQIVTRVACSLQLADRGGPVSRAALNRFQLAVETLGLDINAHVEWQSAGDALTAATALDSFCLEVDKTMGVHLMHGESGAFTGTKLRGLAESQGLTLDADGTFKYFDDLNHKHPSFIMFNRDDYPFSPEMLRSSVVKSVTFQIDIPHVKQCAEAFAHMVQIARQMEIGLNATLVDDNNRVLGDIQIEKIRQQLKVIHATMLVRGIVPGSDSAHRLFS